MFIRGLKTKIALNIAILFFVAMLLINIVAMMTAKRDIIRKEASRGHFLVSLLKDELLEMLTLGMDPAPQKPRAQVFGLFAEAGISNAIVLGKNKEQVAFGKSSQALQNTLIKRCRDVIQSPKRATHFFGTTWGIFWKQPSDLIITSPLMQNGQIVGSVGIVLPLEGI